MPTDGFEPGFDVGDLRHRVVHQKLPGDIYPDGGGDVDQLWDTVGTYWAKVEPLSGASVVNADQRKTVTTYRITLRAGRSIRPGDRLVFRDRALSVESVLEPLAIRTWDVVTATDDSSAWPVSWRDDC